MGEPLRTTSAIRNDVINFLLNLMKTQTPYHLIKAVKPHILVKGCDYKGKAVVGQDIADELKLVQFVEGKSTTKTIEKIQQGKLLCNQ